MSKAKNRQTTGSIFTSKFEGRDFGKYRAEKLLSRHEFRPTITLLAVNKETSERVVLKAFGSFSVKSRKEFEKEIAAFQKLETRHGVLLPLDTFEYEGDSFIVTEYKSGGDLRGWLKTKPKADEILDLFEKVAESIDYIHENKIIHRDIKPENVVYEELDGKITPYLMDFGISVTLPGRTSSFKTEHTFGTAEYMAPEFFSNVDSKKTKAVDIYAFGLMLYEVLEGHHPFIGNTQQETIDHIISRVVPVPENTVKLFGESAGFILTKALSKNPEERPETATEIVAQVGSQYKNYVGKTYGKYVIEEYLGQGTYGSTYKAHELNRKSKKVTLKLLAFSHARKPEIDKLKSLERDKGILPIIDAGYENGAQYLVSEYLDGDSLRGLLSSKGMKIQEFLEILKPLSRTLDYLHENGIVHRDLKPENILFEKNKVDGSLQPLISNCGVSKIVEATYLVNANGNVLLGNPNYLAPEILDGKEPSPAADVYSLGVMIYEATEGETPFDTKSLPALRRQKLNGDVPIPGNLLKSGGILAARVLLKALNVKPQQRQSSASALVSQLDAAIKNRAFPDTEIFVEPWVKAHTFISNFRKNPYAFWISGLLLLAAFWGIFSMNRTPQIPAPSPTSTFTPISPTPIHPTVTITPSLTPSPVVLATTSVPPEPCTLLTDSLYKVYEAPGNRTLIDVYWEQFRKDFDYDALYAITYYNNRKILEGYSQYHAIDPVNLQIGRGWKIAIPKMDWIEKYKQFPATIPFTTGARTPSKLYMSGSSILSPLSARISQCSAQTTGIELIQSDSGNTESGLQDLCQSKVDLFGANKEISPRLGCVELEQFEVARYAMVIFINKDNPMANDLENNPLNPEELTRLLIEARSWSKVRESWDSSAPVARYYPSLESGGFEIVQDGIFPDYIVEEVPDLTVQNDSRMLIDAVLKDVHAVGIVDYDSFTSHENRNGLIVLPVNGVYASTAIAGNDLRYPLMTTLYLYAEKHNYENNEALRIFINYYLSHELDYLDDLGYLFPSERGYRGNPDSVP